jgi:hypothetical protein
MTSVAALDLREVEPIFRVPSCVLILDKVATDGETT